MTSPEHVTSGTSEEVSSLVVTSLDFLNRSVAVKEVQSVSDGQYYDYDYDPLLHAWLDRMAIIQNGMYVYGAPLIIVFGMVGNALSLIILRSRYFAKAACGVLLSILAVIDTGVLLTGLLRVWIMEAFAYNIRIWNLAACRSHYFLTYLMQHLSSWTVVLVTVERFISVYYPLKAKQMFSQRRLRIAIGTLVTTLMVINSHVLFTLDIMKEVYRDDLGNMTVTFCTFPYDYLYGNVIWPWVDFAVVGLLPFLILVTGNSMIVVKVVRNMRRQQLLTQPQQPRREEQKEQQQQKQVNQQHQKQQQQQLEEHEEEQKRQQKQQLPQSQQAPNQQQKQHTQRRRKTSSLTFMLLGITCLFLITVTPYEIYLIGMGHGAWDVQTIRGTTWTALGNTVCELIYYVNNAASFLLYCVSGSRFRMALREYFCRSFRKMRAQSSYVKRSERPKTSSSVLSKQSSG